MTSQELGATSPEVDLSFVIPVFNSATIIEGIVERILTEYNDLEIEVILVNDSSGDQSEDVCCSLQRKYSSRCTFVHLSKNFGEHNAVLAGLNFTTGVYVAVLDDDGQNPPEEVRKMYELAVSGTWDVVYGKYLTVNQGYMRRFGSSLHNSIATMMLGKSKDLYLSSFKVLSRFVVDEITSYVGSFPYIDGLVLRSTRNITQVEVEHHERVAGKSNYTLGGLLSLWLNSFLNFSIIPLRIAAIIGTTMASTSIILLCLIVIDKLYLNPEISLGIPTVLITVVFFSGVQLLILGTIGEYLGRVFLDQSGNPQYIVRYVIRRSTRDG
jgi:undecaprenyl-phosphate 4-deoxy-4-formamido-L-arabinose transferase